MVFAGKQNNVEQWLQSARLFVLTSDSEGLSLALMEAMMAGLPCVVSNVGDLKDLVHEGENGWRPAPRDVETFVQRIVGLLKDPEAYRRFSTAAHAAAYANRPDAMAARWDRILSTWGARPFSAQLPAKWQRSPWVWSRRDLWERTSTVTRWQAAKVFARVSPQTWLGHKFRQTLDWVHQSETWSRDQITAYQLQEVQRIITLAHQSSPFYRKVFRGLGFEPGDLRTLEDLSKLPFIDAETVRQHLHALCTARPDPGSADLISTSGTGGRPLRFFIVRDRSAFEYAHLVASWMRAGYQLGMPMAVLRGRVVPETNGTHYLYDAFLRHHYFSTFQMNDANMARYLSRIEQLGPCYLHVYPSSIAMFARFMQRTRQGPLGNVRGIIAESEIVYPDQRRFVAETLGCRYFSCYGHTEKLVLASECERTPDYHVWPGYGYCELLDANDRPITTPGVRGEIVGTGFINTIVPFIRYRTGDYATYVGDHCAQCGRNHLVLQDIRGHRIHEMLVAADGSTIPWTALNMHDATFDHVLQMQFYQEEPGRAILRVVPDDHFNPTAEQCILQTLGKRLGNRLAITIQRVSALPPTTSGKAVYIDQRIPMTAPKGSQFHGHLEPNH
jgi:phenylacetate-CoA ligase